MDRIRGYIFDIDGTLLDSNDAHAHALQQSFAEAGYDFAYERVRALIGMGLDQIVPKLTGLDPGSAAARRISSAKDRHFAGVFDSLQPFPQARALIATLHAHGSAITVATSASSDDLKKFLTKLGIEEYVQAPTSSDDAESSKPDPDLILEALRKLDLPPQQALMVGDTPYDIQAASRAGVRTVAFRTGGWSDQSLREAVAIYDGPADFLARVAAEQHPSAPQARL